LQQLFAAYQYIVLASSLYNTKYANCSNDIFPKQDNFDTIHRFILGAAQEFARTCTMTHGREHERGRGKADYVAR
jgi:hypothetical protein